VVIRGTITWEELPSVPLGKWDQRETLPFGYSENSLLLLLIRIANIPCLFTFPNTCWDSICIISDTFCHDLEKTLLWFSDKETEAPEIEPGSNLGHWEPLPHTVSNSPKKPLYLPTLHTTALTACHQGLRHLSCPCLCYCKSQPEAVWSTEKLRLYDGRVRVGRCLRKSSRGPALLVAPKGKDSSRIECWLGVGGSCLQF
jgi:hypothetical protein